MAPLIRFDQVSLAFGDQVILAEADLAIEAGERVCLIGRNGAGKSSTLKLISGLIEPDGGEIFTGRDLRMSLLDQELAGNDERTVREVVSAGMAAQQERIDAYHRLASEQGIAAGTLMRELEHREKAIEAGGGWSISARIEAMMSQLDLPADKPLSALSGGWRRRVALGKALVSQPDLLLLDEPTNHLDISTIEWLERELLRYPGALLFVTHDRSFVERIATRIVQIDRGQLRSWPGGYRDFLRRRAEADAAEDRQYAEFDKKLAQEEEWIRQGIKARGRRNEGRVRALEALRAERAERIARPRAPRIHVNEADSLSGRKVVELRNVSHSYAGKALFQPLTLRILRGDRIGIVGNNGVGKSTLLRILLGELTPTEGSVKLGTNLEVAYFDQLRRSLAPDQTVAETIGEGREYIGINGKQKHVVGYLTDFLFTPKRAMTPVGALSGGERNRVILAKLFTRPANLLVLDEPTNDLDVETLEALERRLAEYQGTLIVVSHDRAFLDQVVTSLLVFEADGAVRRHAGGYSDWARKQRTLAGEPAVSLTSRSEPHAPARSRPEGSKKLSYHLKRELEALPARIDELERQLAEQQAKTSDPAFYAQPPPLVAEQLKNLHLLQQELDAALERWIALEAQAG